VGIPFFKSTAKQFFINNKNPAKLFGNGGFSLEYGEVKAINS